MSNEPKGIKQLAKDAKKRLKSGFWQNYRQSVVAAANKAKEEGLSSSKVVEFYENKSVRGGKTNKEDAFYSKVKLLLETEGEVSDAIGRLIDHSVFDLLDYNARQKYLLELSNSYRDAVERFRREKRMIEM